VRKLLSEIVLLLSVLLMPFGMTPASAAHDQRPMASMPMGHCDKDTSTHGVKGGVADCTMACSAALPATDTAREEPLLLACTPARPVAAQVLHGLTPETADPPPRRA
jgi:hypothetical protein